MGIKTLPEKGRFVLLSHASGKNSLRPNHFDLMLEGGSDLVTLELQSLPQEPGIYPILRLPDHRQEYLDYQGEISGGRGTVTRLARGQFVSNATEGACQLEFDSPELSALLRIIGNNQTLAPVGTHMRMFVERFTWNAS